MQQSNGGQIHLNEDMLELPSNVTIKLSNTSSHPATP